MTFVCWVCRVKLANQPLPPLKENWGKCTTCGKTREARKPVPVKLQPLTKREQEKAARQ